MGAQESLSVSGLVTDPRPPSVEQLTPERELPRALFIGTAVAATAVLVVLSRDVFLFWDDFYFLGQAREADLTWSYLTDPLFRHFSPVVRVVNLWVVDAIPEHPWVVPLVLFVLLAGVATSVTWLMVALHGRTGPALLGSVILAPSLTLLPLGNWWTAGINIMPALIAFYVAFGAMVQLLRGRSRVWAVPCFVGAGVGVLDYELPMLLFCYLGLWFLLFGPRVTKESLRATVRRTWWAWLGVSAIGIAAVLNYRLNYYDPTPRPSTVDVVHATGRSLVRTLIPTAVGFHDPHSPAFSALSLAIGCVGLVLLVAWLGLTRRGWWRGLLFAGAGWLLPTLALVLNRVSLFGVVVVDNAIYYHLPTVLVMIGVLEAVRAPRRGTRAATPGSLGRRVVVLVLVGVAVSGYAWSAKPTARYQLPMGASASYIEQVRDSVAALRATGEKFSVLNSDVSGSIVPGAFAPYNRADRVLDVAVPALSFDDPSRSLYRLSDSGELVPVGIDWLDEATPATPGELKLRNGSREEGPPGNQLCFEAEDTTSVIWLLPTMLTGPDLVVRTVATVETTTPLRVLVRAANTTGFERANVDMHELRGSSAGVLDTVTAASVDAVRLKDFEPGARVCIESVAVGRVVPSS
jgi:hypothetical protein